ncbi:MAG: hypothetical protein IJO20_02430 [Ruminococcus sp.]|nr:hypothetical protein [Ruminococcus sp.]
MKKTMIIVLSVVMIMCIAAVGAFAADRDRNRACKEESAVVCETQSCTVNCDEICDNKNYVDADNDGVCDNYSENCNNTGADGKNYADADSDGVCDNYSTPNYNQKGKHCKNRCNW